eukprot:scaffold153527_cov15-Tisochrysis_lutea.AAC.1
MSNNSVHLLSARELGDHGSAGLTCGSGIQLPVLLWDQPVVGEFCTCKARLSEDWLQLLSAQEGQVREASQVDAEKMA